MGSAFRIKQLTFDRLVQSICSVHDTLFVQATRAVNTSLTLRNWVIGMYIAEFELRGSGRARYGENLFSDLAVKLAQRKVSGCRFRQLYNYTAFYRAYPQIVRTVSAKSRELILTIRKPTEKLRTVSAKFTNDPEQLVTGLSYSHFEMLVEINDPLKRSFYEHECLRGRWEVLKR